MRQSGTHEAGCVPPARAANAPLDSSLCPWDGATTRRREASLGIVRTNATGLRDEVGCILQMVNRKYIQ
jgi:hypothetical protein